jgi:hypothetical protein
LREKATEQQYFYIGQAKQKKTSFSRNPQCFAGSHYKLKGSPASPGRLSLKIPKRPLKGSARAVKTPLCKGSHKGEMENPSLIQTGSYSNRARRPGSRAILLNLFFPSIIH